MPLAYILNEAWRWLADTGINLALLIVLALLVPRAGRFFKRWAERRAESLDDAAEAKSHLAIAGVGIYIAQAILFFLILVFILQQVGFSLAGAAIPATVVSAAIGFGAQNIIADFLAGFFILSEKQYGVGDFVTFEGNGISVSGDVIQITMRATQIRTLEQSTISIPNSTARICINQSNHWASALVVVPVPLLGSASADEAVARSESAARRALNEPDIRPKALDELAVHPAVDINPPVTVGMPWTVDMRFIVRVEPLSQWMVERAIRMSILNEFWEEYGSANTIEGTRIDHVVDHTEHFESVDRFPPTEYMPPVHTGAFDQTDTEFLASSVDSEEDPATDTLEAPEKPMPHMAFGGAMRLSTALLLGSFLLLLIIRGLTLSPEDDTTRSGWLAPPRETPTSTTPTPEPSEAETPVQQTTTPEPTSEQLPTTNPPVPETPAPSTEPEAPSATPSVTEAPAAPEGASPSDAPTSLPATPLG